MPKQKPNLLFINSITIYGGGEVWMVNTAKEFSALGYNVTLVCKENAEIIKHAEKNKIDVIPSKLAGDLDPFSIFNLIKILKQRKIGVVIANTGKDLRLSGFASWFVKGVKVIARQGIDYPLKNNLRYRFAYNTLAHSIIANSLATKNTLLSNAPWLKPDKIKVIYNGINPELYLREDTIDLRNEFGFNAEDFIIGFVGRLSVQKGIEPMLKAFKLVSEKFSQVHLLIVGDGELRDLINKFSSDNQLTLKIHHVGFRDDIPNIMRTIDVLLLPSLWEGFGIVLIEAMVSGKPVVASRTSSIPEIVESGRNGLLVSPGNVEEIANALIKILNDSELRIKFSLEGEKIVNEKFTINKMIEEYEKVFYS